MAEADKPMTLPAALAATAARYGPRVAYVAGRRDPQPVTWSEVYSRAAAFAAGLVALGLQKGDRVAICAENGVEWVVACHGTLMAGGVLVPIYYDLKHQEISDQVRRPECRVVVASDATLAKIPERSPGLERVVVIGEGRREARGGLLRRHPAETLAFEAVAAAATSESRQALLEREPRPDDLAAIIFTSGTTGGAKGVMLTHRNFMANAHSTLRAIDIDEDDSVLLVLPLHHAMPFIAAIVLVCLAGARVVIENDVRRVRDRMATEKPTLFFGVPALYDIMYRNVLARAESEGRLETLRRWQARVLGVKERTGVNIGPLLFRQVHAALGGRLRFLVSGGAALNPQTARNFFSLGLPLLQGWGMTEASPVVAVQRYSARRFRFTKYYEEHVGSVGPPIPGVEVKLIDVPDKDIRVSLQGEGEVIVRGENVFQGYWHAEEQTRAAKLGEWLLTGDLGRIDEDGNIYLTGRSKYIIVLESGEKVHPDEVEEKLAESQVLEDVCVLGRKTRDKTQVAAVVYPNVASTIALLEKEGLQPSEETVRRVVSGEVDRLMAQLAPYKRISQVLLADTPLPKTPLRKIARSELSEEYRFSVQRWRDSQAESEILPS
ncbi:MAG TPA: AMP-binding protein [Dehalococcoidia bacterium]|nr:AMP-binding protein [Dehalococcoidia bacterium]